jgi:type IV pilus assembly protein PilC
MVYPLVVSLAAVSIALAMIIFIVPVFQGLFEQFGAKLPLPTRMLVKTSELLVPPDGALIPIKPLAAILVAAAALTLSFLLQQAKVLPNKFALLFMLFAVVGAEVLFFMFGGAVGGSLFEVPKILAALFRLFMLFVMFVLALMGLRKFIATEDGRRFWDALKLRLPVKIGKLMRTIALANFAGNFGTMLRAGVPMLVAIEVVKESINNVIVEEELDSVRTSIQRGYGIAPPLIASPLFPNMFAKMVEVGEQTGKTDEMLEKLNEFYSDEIENTVKALASLVEPLMILVVGGMVGVIVISLFLPIFDIYSTVSSQI